MAAFSEKKVYQMFYAADRKPKVNEIRRGVLQSTEPQRYPTGR